MKQNLTARAACQPLAEFLKQRGEGGKDIPAPAIPNPIKIEVDIFFGGGTSSTPRWEPLEIQRCSWGREDPPNAKTACQDPTTGSFLLERKKKKIPPRSLRKLSTSPRCSCRSSNTTTSRRKRRRREDFKMRIHQCHFWYVLRSFPLCFTLPARASLASRSNYYYFLEKIQSY